MKMEHFGYSAVWAFNHHGYSPPPSPKNTFFFQSLRLPRFLPSLASKQHNFIIVAVNTVIIEERGGERLPYYTFNENIADAHWVNIEF